MTAAIDAIDAPVVLVGHSGGGAIAWAAVDARPDRVARVIYVDSGPLAEGGCVNDEIPIVNGEAPLPDWSFFEPDDLIDLTDELREHFRAIAIPEPARVTSDPIHLTDPRRYEVPATIICCEFRTEQLRVWLEQGEMAEIPKLTERRPRRPADRALAAVHQAGRTRGDDPGDAASHLITCCMTRPRFAMVGCTGAE